MTAIQPTTTSISKNTDDRTKSGTNAALGTALLTGIGGAGIGYFSGEEITAQRVLEKPDEFVLKGELSAEEQKVADAVKAIIDGKENTEKAIEEQVSKTFKRKTEITAQDYLRTTPEKLEKDLNAAKEEAEALTKTVGAKKENLGKVIQNLQDAKNPIVKLWWNIREKFARRSFNAAIKEFNENSSFIEQTQPDLEFVKNLKDGKITKDMLKEHLSNSTTARNLNTIEEALKILSGKLEKLKSGKKALIFGAVAAVLGFITSKLVMKPKNPEAEKQKAQIV